MSAGSASPPTERQSGVDPLTLERLIGVRSSKPSFYAAWRDKSARLDHTIETLERISTALCAAPAGPVAVCDAVVEAAAHHFDARWAAMVFSEDAGVGLARVFVHASQGVIQRWEVPPRMLEALTHQTLAVKGPVLADHDEGLGFGGEPCVIVAAPMPVHGKLAGILVVGLPEGVEVAPSDVSILVTLANHAGVALHNASLFQENERRASELERRGSELEGTLRRLEQAGRRQLPRALREVIEDVEAGTRLEVGLRVYGQSQPVAAATQHALVQIAREALFNVVRHAEARRAWVTLRWRPQVVSLGVADDGSGNHRKLQHQLFMSRTDGDHLGLAGIAERVRELGGASWFERRRGGGVKLRIEVPLGGAVGVA